ncbi:hypothetical protein CEXT_522011 [Caerostris extrusa]|uniref:Uncharacterized protein n=1 Tax=Caerostris extrusa TaxID=172846 RepID=A0AAV4QGP9_CAEEX|nr:hypothetical protein CEXT_522011 [Caerostris extrusa]
MYTNIRAKTKPPAVDAIFLCVAPTWVSIIATEKYSLRRRKLIFEPEPSPTKEQDKGIFSASGQHGLDTCKETNFDFVYSS